ncbi:MAG: FAD-binding protein [Alphaproteobacteria bacterium]
MEQYDISSEADIIAAVQEALANVTPLAVEGQGTKRHIGCECMASHAIRLAGHSGITTYEPRELYITAKAGTPLAEIADALNTHNQMLAFEPPFGDGTIGGLVMAGLAGPRRVSAGSVRDHILGLRAVSGRGELFQAGGTVVKNVTGYDLPKLMVGSWGTLAVLSEVTLKVLPAPKLTHTLIWQQTDRAKGLAFLRKVWRSVYEPTGLRYDNGQCLVRLEGMDASLKERADALQAEFGVADQIMETPWENTQASGLYWRMTIQPDEAAAFADQVGGDLVFDWAGGLVHATGAFDQSGALNWLQSHGGGLVVMGGGARPASPINPSLRLIHQRLKEQFDPLGILNPGRLQPELGL